MDPFHKIYLEIIDDPRYKRNIQYGKPRRGHSEGTVEAHIAELERNLEMLELSGPIYWKLKVLIHVHDSFKAEAKRNSPILDPESHASLAATFLSEFTDDLNMLYIVQYHDIGYAVFKTFKETGKMKEGRLLEAFNLMSDLDLFLWFAIIDACTESKGREMITWLVEFVNKNYQVNIKVENILPGEWNVGESW